MIGDVPDRKGKSSIGVIVVLQDSDVHRNDLSLFYRSLSRYPVHHLVIYGDADGSGKSPISFECGIGALLSDKILRQSV